MQGQVVAQAPPPIVFDDWKKIAESQDAVEYSLTFPSAYTSRFPENDTVSLRIIMPADVRQPAPVVILLHYLGATDLKIERSISSRLAENGVASVIMALPYHLSRTPKGYASGELAIQPDPEKLIETMTQSVWDARRTMDWISTRPELDSSRIGIGGTSLGALVATLAYALDPRIKKASFLLSGADLANILWHSSRVVGQREVLRSKGYSESKLREALKDIEPLSYLPRREPAATLVIGARHDTVIPPVDTQKLIDALGSPKVIWIGTGHYGGAFVQGKLLRIVASFFTEELNGRTFEPPARIYAPTIRVGVDANAISGVQVGIGLDIWRSNVGADAFGNLMFTPRGMELFVGRNIDRGLAIGLTVTRRGLSPGAFWSAIL